MEPSITPGEDPHDIDGVFLRPTKLGLRGSGCSAEEAQLHEGVCSHQNLMTRGRKIALAAEGKGANGAIFLHDHAD
ncbi:MAG: hypothetical protein JSR45_14030 [Proteobacteria bacterium]|nr:hypothetical protein [Pseudomonadota bacterium]